MKPRFKLIVLSSIYLSSLHATHKLLQPPQLLGTPCNPIQTIIDQLAATFQAELDPVISEVGAVEALVENLSLDINSQSTFIINSLGTTISDCCSSIHALEESIIDLEEASLSKVCVVDSKIDALEQTIIDQSQLVINQLGQTIVDQSHTVIDQTSHTIIDEGTAIINDLGQTICDKALSIIDDLSATIIDQNISTIDQLGQTIVDQSQTIINQLSTTVIEEIDILFSKIMVLDSKIDTIQCESNPCGIMPLSQPPMGNPININMSGSYCLTQDVIANININASNVCLDLNCRQVTGIITVNGTSSITISNGKITPPAPAVSADAIIGAINIVSGSLNVKVSNCSIVNADSTGNSGTTGFNGRDGINNNGTNSLITDCFIQTGTGASGTLGNIGGNGGTGIVNNGNNLTLKETIIIAGNGGTTSTGSGGRGGFCITSSGNNALITKSVFNAGNGGNGSISTGIGGDSIIWSGTDGKIIECIIRSGNAGTTLTINGGSGGFGIRVISPAQRNIIQKCFIASTGSGSSGVSTNGSGGVGIQLNIGTSKNQVSSCIIANLGVSGSGTNSLAINDVSGSSQSIIFSNFAYNTKRTVSSPAYILDFSAALDAPNGTLFAAGTNRFANVYKS